MEMQQTSVVMENGMQKSRKNGFQEHKIARRDQERVPKFLKDQLESQIKARKAR